MKNYNYIYSLLVVCIATLITACSTTSAIPDDEQLYTGIDKVEYTDYEKCAHASYTQSEIYAALACPPNGSLFGSSRHRSPFPVGLWIWNAWAKSKTSFGKWVSNTFGKDPIYISTVNAPLRATVAKTTLKSHGYLNGEVESYVKTSSNPKKAKVGYKVAMNHLYTLDTVRYVNFPQEAMVLIDSTASESKITTGVPFDISRLDEERERVSKLFKNSGYYYYQPSYMSYLADTMMVPGKVQLKLQVADSVPDKALRKWYIGKVDLSLKRNYFEQMTDSLGGRRFTVHFNGKKPPVRMGTILRDMKLRRGKLFCYDDYLESMSLIGGNGLFSSVDFKLTPKDETPDCDTLNVNLTCVLEKPYDFYIETNLRGKTTGFLGPQLVVGLTRRNAFRGGEKLDINLHGSYEWQIGHKTVADENDGLVDSYDYGGDVSLEFPRLYIPFVKYRRRFYTTPTTTVKGSMDIISRSGYFKRHIVSGEMTYKIQPTANIRHTISPLVLEYTYLRDATEKFIEIMLEHPYLLMSMLDQFIPKARYTFTYTSPSSKLNPILWETTVSESANLLSLGYMIAGRKWYEKEKEMFNNPFAQFFKIETDFTKTWRLSPHSQLVAHANVGAIWAYGNSEYAPYTEQFYVGGANSIRAFPVRSIGPGTFHSEYSDLSYALQTGDFRLLLNLEYRARLFGNLYGALFLDAGNVWMMRSDVDYDDDVLNFKKLPEQLALGTGIGLRYDLDFFVIRVDWGLGLHLPYNTGSGGYFNIPSFNKGQCLNLAIGYPF